MNNFITISASARKMAALPSVEISELPAKLSKRLWIEPDEMVNCLHRPIANARKSQRWK